MSEFIGYQVWTDGGNRNGNPGVAAGAFIIELPTGDRIEQVTFIPRGTNNEAEYTGLIEALKYLHNVEAAGGHHILIRSDSQLMVRQVNGQYQCGDNLRRYWEEAVGLFELLKADALSLELIHIPREQNKEVDAICAEFLDLKTNSKRKMK